MIIESTQWQSLFLALTVGRGDGLVNSGKKRYFILIVCAITILSCAQQRPVLYPNAHLNYVGKETAESDIEGPILSAAGVPLVVEINARKIPGEFQIRQQGRHLGLNAESDVEDALYLSLLAAERRLEGRAVAFQLRALRAMARPRRATRAELDVSEDRWVLKVASETSYCERWSQSLLM